MVLFSRSRKILWILGPLQFFGLGPCAPGVGYGTGTSPVFWFGSPCAFMGFVLNERQSFLVGSYYVPGMGCISWRSSPTADVYNVGTFPVFWFGLHVFLLWAA